MNADLVIEVENLRKSYRATEAVKGLSFSINRGETFGLLGPNGAGKTTTVEILAGLRSRSSGEVRVLGADPSRAGRVWRSRIGVVAQAKHDHDSWRTGELLAQLAGCYSNPMAPSEALERVGLSGHERATLSSLSGGMRRRFEVAAGIVGRPEVLFLDEPTTGFDPEARRSFWGLVRQLNHDGTTVILTTHYLDEAEALADRVLVVNHGVEKALCHPSELGNTNTSTVTWGAPDGPHRQTTADAAELVAQLIGAGEPISNLQVTTPSLEERYLTLIGDAA